MRERKDERNPDKEGSHPISTGVGAGAGGLAGAAAGSVVAGPAGTIIGAALGGIAGGAAGHNIGELVNPAQEEAYWRDNYRDQPYYAEGRGWDDYAPAYRLGYEGRIRYDGRAYDDVEDLLAADYMRLHDGGIGWDEVRPATRAAWDRVDARVQTGTRN